MTHDEPVVVDSELSNVDDTTTLCYSEFIRGSTTWLEREPFRNTWTITRTVIDAIPGLYHNLVQVLRRDLPELWEQENHEEKLDRRVIPHPNDVSDDELVQHWLYANEFHHPVYGNPDVPYEARDEQQFHGLAVFQYSVQQVFPSLDVSGGDAPIGAYTVLSDAERDSPEVLHCVLTRKVPEWASFLERIAPWDMRTREPRTACHAISFDNDVTTASRSSGEWYDQ